MSFRVERGSWGKERNAHIFVVYDEKRVTQQDEVNHLEYEKLLKPVAALILLVGLSLSHLGIQLHQFSAEGPANNYITQLLRKATHKPRETSLPPSAGCHSFPYAAHIYIVVLVTMAPSMEHTRMGVPHPIRSCVQLQTIECSACCVFCLGISIHMQMALGFISLPLSSTVALGGLPIFVAKG